MGPGQEVNGIRHCRPLATAIRLSQLAHVLCGSTNLHGRWPPCVHVSLRLGDRCYRGRDQGGGRRSQGVLERHDTVELHPGQAPHEAWAVVAVDELGVDCSPTPKPTAAAAGENPDLDLEARKSESNRAQEAYSTLSTADCKVYKRVKSAVLKAYELVPEAYRQRFRGWKRGDKQSHVEFVRDLTAHFGRWCAASEVDTFEKLCNLVILEQFKNSVPKNVATYLTENKVGTPGQAAVLADEYVLIHKSNFNAVPVKILRDTGSLDSFVCKSVLPFSSETDTGDFVLVRGMGMVVFPAPVHRLCFVSGLVKGDVEMGVRTELPVDGVDIILGNGLAGAQLKHALDMVLRHILLHGPTPHLVAACRHCSSFPQHTCCQLAITIPYLSQGSPASRCQLVL
ncbi:hypothetical protein N1851_034377 [Merluccius polli]|uniref:SCAN box domain-containing protein n=1 Tax=Merluccius polli TaxID=89951 RepID=A0AA47LZN3_MERPO|nr:hypothetical protein N1851_034377 [Merluccius polli]